ncbi:phospholipase A [Silvimonas sp. JCM 19000]
MPTSTLHHPLKRPFNLRALACALALLSTSALAEVNVLHPASSVQPGAPLTLTLLIDNPTQSNLPVAIPGQIQATVSNADFPNLAPFTLTRVGNSGDSVTLKPGEFRRVAYSTALPTTLRGAVRVQVIGFDTAPVLIAIDQGDKATLKAKVDAEKAAQAEAANTKATDNLVQYGAAAPTTETAAVAAAQVATPGALDTDTAALLRTTESRLSGYEPMYFAVGKNGDWNAKFQISFKYRLMLPADPASRAFLDNLYFAYSQRSFWNLSAKSHPFDDSSYMPSLFYYTPDTGIQASWYQRMGLEAGLRHESNGKGDPGSRSFNSVYVQPILHFGDPTKNEWVVAPKLYWYPIDSDNPDMRNYRGYVDLNVSYGNANGWQFATTLRKGTKSDYGSAEFQATYPVARIWRGLGGYLFADYFTGYGEDLEGYNAHTNQVRVGYSITRWAW